MTGLTAGGFVILTALRAEGCGIALTGDEYKASVTGFTFLCHRACFPPGKVVAPATKRGAFPRPTVSTGYSAPVGIQESTLPADWYLPALLSLTVLTKILRFVETLQRVSKSAEVGP